MKFFSIVLQEWKTIFRNKVASLLFALLSLLAIITIVGAGQRTHDYQEKLAASKAYMRDKFTGQGAVNPHGAAHYGHYVYKPISTLSVLDNGVNDFTGVSLYLEGHRQNETSFSPSQGSSSLVRFGQLTLALLLQFLMPLFIIFVCHNAISREREQRTLPLLLAQTVSLRQLVWGKIAAYTLIWAGFLSLILIVLRVYTGADSAEPVAFTSFAMLWSLYTLYYFLITGITVLVSTFSKSSGSALLKMLFAWLICTILLPKIAANLGDNFAPLLTKIELEERISTDKKNGIDGHNPSSERNKRFKDSLIATYGVSTIDSIPVNLDGLLMQADEEYNNIVFDKHFGSIRNTIDQQRAATAFSSWLNPFAAVRNLSMGLAGTDVYQHFEFTRQAEEYRRKIIKIMNDAQAYGGSKTGDWDWAVEPEFWSKIEDFKYESPTTMQVLGRHPSELSALLLWTIGLVLLVQFSTKKSNRLA